MSEPLQAVTDREVTLLTNIVRRQVRDWQWLVSSFGWMVDYDYHREQSAQDDDARSLFAEAHSTWRYLSAKICFYLPAVRDLIFSDIPAHRRAERLELQIVHEFVHVLLKEMEEDHNDPGREDAYKHQERVAESLARVIIEAEKRGYRLGYDDAKKGKVKRGHLATGAGEIARAHAGPGEGPQRPGRAR